MTTKKMKILASHVLFIGTLVAQTVHTVPFGSSKNAIDLFVKNTDQSATIVEVTESPNWLQFSQKKIVLDEASIAHFTFSVDKSAVVNQTQKVVIGITNAEGKRWTKEISIQVAAPTTFEVFQNYPNPFNPATSIHFQIPQAGKVVLKVFDILGKEIAILKNQEMEAGGHVAEWNAQSVSSGMYFYRLEYGGKVVVKKMLFMK